jgi:hypothetical protein
MRFGSAGTVAARCSKRRRKKIQAAGGSRAASSPFLSSPAVTYKAQKMQQADCFHLLSLFLDLPLSLLL